MIVLLHWLHAGVIIAGVAAVVLLLSPWPSGRRHGRVQDLRAAAEAGSLVRRAEARALAQLTGQSTDAAAAGSSLDHLVARTAARQPPLVVIIALGSLAGAAIHAAVGPEHFEEGWRFGVFFVVLSLVQCWQAGRLVLRPTRRLMEAVAAVNAATVVLWTVTRTVGLPFGLAEVEEVGVLDAVCSATEVAVVLGALVWLARTAPRRVTVAAPIVETA